MCPAQFLPFKDKFGYADNNIHVHVIIAECTCTCTCVHV